MEFVQIQAADIEVLLLLREEGCWGGSYQFIDLEPF
jgi:hypothetical protein